MTTSALLIAAVLVPSTAMKDPVEIRSVTAHVRILEITGAMPKPGEELTKEWLAEVEKAGKVSRREVFHSTTVVGTTAKLQVGREVPVQTGFSASRVGKRMPIMERISVGSIVNLEPQKANEKLIQLKAYIESSFYVQMAKVADASKVQGDANAGDDFTFPERVILTYESTAALKPGEPLIARAQVRSGTKESHFVIVIKATTKLLTGE
jgi:hypothetical protein